MRLYNPSSESRPSLSSEQTVFAVQMHPERTEANPRLEMVRYRGCGVTLLAFKNAFSHPFCILGPWLLQDQFCHVSISIPKLP